MSEIDHDTELRVWALQRSGHHAVIEWLLAGAEGGGGAWVFLNHVEPGRNPFAAVGCDRERSRSSGKIAINWEAEAAGEHAEGRRWLVYNLEDRGFAEGTAGDAQRERWLGRAGERRELIVLRDPFNNLASKLKWFEGRGIEPDAAAFHRYVELWKEQARETLHRTHLLADPTLTILYNRWFTDTAYREELAAQLGLTSAGPPPQRVARFGPLAEGESFDALAYDGRAEQMRTLDRWRRFEGDAFYRSLFRDEELLELSRAVFGEMAAEVSLRGT